MRKLVILIVWLLAISVGAMAQADKAKQLAYKTGVELCKKLKYAEALPYFNEVATGTFGAFSPKAEYFKALCLFHTAKFAEAVQTINSVYHKSNDPTFRQEATFLKSVSLMGNEQLREGLEIAQKLPISMKESAYSMKLYYLNGLPKDTLEVLHKLYDDDEVINELLCEYLLSEPEINVANKIRALALAKKSGNASLIDKVARTEVAGVKGFEVAVLLPLSIRENNFKPTLRKNSFAIEFMKGFQLAAHELKGPAGEDISLSFFDSEKSAEKISSLIKSGSLNNAAVIVGPLFSQGADLLADYAAKNGKLYINPLSTKLLWDTSNANAFITGTTIEMKAKLIADASLNLLPCTKVAVIYGNEVNDSLLANEYISVIKQRGVSAVSKRRIKLGERFIASEFLKAVGLDSTGHLFAVTDRPAQMVQIVSALKLVVPKANLICGYNWLEPEEYTPDQLEKLNALFYDVDRVEYDKPEAKKFANDFKQVTGLAPGDYAWSAFETVNSLLGFYIKNYAKGTVAIRSAEIPGLIMKGYDFRSSADNAKFQLAQLKAGVLTLTSDIKPNDTK